MPAWMIRRGASRWRHPVVHAASSPAQSHASPCSALDAAWSPMQPRHGGEDFAAQDPVVTSLRSRAWFGLPGSPTTPSLPLSIVVTGRAATRGANGAVREVQLLGDRDAARIRVLVRTHGGVRRSRPLRRRSTDRAGRSSAVSAVTSTWAARDPPASGSPPRCSMGIRTFVRGEPLARWPRSVARACDRRGSRRRESAAHRRDRVPSITLASTASAVSYRSYIAIDPPPLRVSTQRGSTGTHTRAMEALTLNRVRRVPKPA